MGKLKYIFIIGLICFVGSFKASAQNISVADSLALVDFYNSTNGPNWTIKTNWLQPNVPARNWWGIDVRSDGTLWRINLSQNNLSGSIPASFGNLTGLEDLNLWKNNLTGSIPTTFGQLVNLIELRIHENQLSGSIPSQIGQLTSLTYIRLNNNQLSGNLPPTIGNLTALETLILVNNSLSGSIPTQLSQLSNLTNLQLSTNSFTGSIPGVLGQLAQLEQLTLNGNNLTGSIPIELGNLSNLTTLGLDQNQLTGDFPTALLQLSNLAILTLSGNQLSGSLPSTIDQLSNLRVLLLNDNQFSGSIPTSLANINLLNTVRLYGNNLSGPIPANLSNLSFFNIENNNLLFSNLETNHAAYQANMISYTFSPQAKVDQEETLAVDENGSITLTSTDLTSANNSYQWYKDGVAISGATSKDYVISNAAASDAGVYYFEATNSVVTGLTLTRNNITLSVTPDTCGVSATEKQALLDLYNSTNGANWTNTLAANQPWDTNIPVCDWYGVTVLNGNVTYIQLPDNNLDGPLPTTLGNLSNVTLFIVYSNSINGSIPTEIGQMTSLTNLQLRSNNLSGNIPVEIGQLTNLSTLLLSNNNLTGSIPVEIGQLASLGQLWLYENSLTGTIPTQIGQMSSLYNLNLSANQLSGAIPSEIGQITSLQALTLGKNNLTSIPTTLNQLANLTSLSLNENSFTGPIPTLLGQLTELRSLRLDYNQFSGSIPSELGQLTNLTNLSLNNNQLTGSIPSTFGQLVNIQSMDLSVNNLDGNIPSSFDQFQSLVTLRLNNNNLDGAIPAGLAQITGLGNLLIDENNFSGNLANFSNISNTFYMRGNNFVFSDFESEHASYLSNLNFYTYSPQAKVDQEETLAVLENGSITLSSTALTSANNSYQWYKDGVAIAGATTKDYVISNAASADAGVYYFEATNSVVTGLTLTRNDITLGVTPDTCGVSAAEKQALLDLYNSTNGANWTNTVANNQPWDTNIPVCDWFGVTVVNGNVTAVQIGNNNLSGTIPSSISNLTELVTLRLHSNSLTGTIPSSLGNLTKLVTLYCRINQLSGNIPLELGNIGTLQILDFSSNNLDGTLPSSFGNLSNLRGLELNNNQFSGTIPVNYGNLSSLLEMKLSSNQLTGSIPTELGNLTALEQLWLQGNQLTGTIPSQLGTPGNSIDDLNLSNNQLTGPVPSELGNLTDLRFFRLSNNQLNGNIPIELGSLTNVIDLDFQSNNLTGSIPTELGGMSSLLDLKLANNQLDGSLPTSLTNIISLRGIFISNNDFSGDIPAFGNLSNFIYLSFIENAFVFSDFETEHPSYTTDLTIYQFSPQSKVDQEEILAVAEGGNITLTSTALTSANNSYQWYKDGVAIAGATSKDYVISNATAADAGVYYFEATNSVVTGLTLTRNDITLSINANTCGVSATEKQALLDLYNSTNGANWTNTLASNQPWDTNIPVCDWFGVTVVNGNVTRLELPNNDLSGNILSSIGNLVNIEFFNLSQNNLQGSIPSEIGDMISLQSLFLQTNQLNGNIPDTIGNLNSLSILSLFANNLTGTIPDSMVNLINLRTLYLGGNELSGEIPTWIGNLIELRDIRIYQNNFVGQIPIELTNLSNLITLQLYGNNLTGSIPSGVGNMPELRNLEVYNNLLTGQIPESLASSDKLLTLSVFNNQLTGKIPDFTLVTTLNRFQIRANSFVFSDFETEHSTYSSNISTYWFSPQAKVDQEEVLAVQEFGSITLTSTDLTSVNNSYQWYKDGVAISGATSKDYVISNATAADAGVYYFEATNSVVTGLTLTRNNITLTVEPGSNTIVQQRFCTSDGTPTIADLVVPTPDGITPVWYPTETGGTPLSSTQVLQNNTVYWRDYTGNTNGRAGVEAIIDALIPVGNPVQSFDAATNPTLANIVVSVNPSSSANQVQWYATATSTTALPNATLLQDETTYFAAENATTCRLAIRVNVEPEEICIEIVSEGSGGASAIEGSFEGAANVIIPNNRNEAMGASGWSATLGTPDTFTTPYANSTDPYLQSSFSASPNGGICAGGLRYQNTTEAFAANITGLQAGTTYVVEFYAANVTNAINAAVSKEALGFWEVTFAGTTKSTPLMGPNVSEATTWKRQRLEFNASSSTQLLEFKVGGNASDQNNAYPVYMLIDGVRVYVKPQSTSTMVCATIETQVFCNGDDENPATIGDLASPTGNSVTWHSSPFNGIRYFESVELGNVTSAFVWADEGNGGARIPVEILLDLGAPTGDSHQSFDVSDSPTLADLVVQGTNITWHTSYTSTAVLATSTPLVNDAIYYAAQDGNPCRLSVQVFVGIPTLEGDANQEFCSSTNPTVADLVMPATNPAYSVIWYATKTGGAVYNSTDSLVDGQIYYASQTNGTDSSEELYPVRVSVIDTAEENKLYERNVEVAAGTTIADLTTFFELDAGVLWYDFPQSGTAYSGSYTLIDGETYYARISEGLCDALEVLAVTVAIEDVVNPELVSCIKFLPQSGNRYVISGWVREHAATAVPTNTLEFTEKESFITLLDHLTSKISNAEHIPAVYELHKDPEAPNVNALLPFIRNFTGTNVTVYNFQYETEQIGLQQVAVGYSFALAPDNLYRFVYRTPRVALLFNSPTPSGFSIAIPLDYHYPILNYGNIDIEYTDVDIVGNTFRITSNFNLLNASDSEYKTDFAGHTTDSDTDSGIEANVQLFDYVEEPQHTVMDYLNTSITLEYKDVNDQPIVLSNSSVIFEPKGAIIDGWQRISGDFTIPSNAANMKIFLKNDGAGLNAYFDDIRMHPFDSNMKSFVYDPITQRLQAELDENNYATFYEYDTEGGLVRVKKETERGVYTIQETRSGNSKLNNGSE